MKLNHLSLMALAAAALLAGCAKEPLLNVEQNGDMIPLNISSSISQKPTRATAEGFVDKDALGLFAVNYIENNTVAGTLQAEGNQADNVKYVFDEGNHKWSPVKAVYYKDVNTHADLYAYYPYQANIKDVNAANFEVQKDQSTEATANRLGGYEASDFLWGKAEDITPTQSAIAIALSHRLSAVEVTLVEGTGFAQDEFAGLEKSVILTNTTRKATVNYATGVAAPLGGPQLDGIVMCPQDAGSWRAIVIPQTVGADVQLFAITVNGVSYSFRQSSATEYQAGKQMNVSITVSKKTPAGDFQFTLADTQITEWVEDRNTHGGEARQYFVVNVTEPGTLGKTIKGMGKDPDKIKNLKVVGNVKDADFYFMRDSMAILEAVNMKESNLHNNCIPNNAFYSKNSIFYFVFPDNVNTIENRAFASSNLTGSLIIPNSVTKIGTSAFSNTMISSVIFGNQLEFIGDSSFSSCESLCCELKFPQSLRQIGNNAFDSCNLKGRLIFPDNLESIGSYAFNKSGSFDGDLCIPPLINEIPDGVFQGASFSGQLFMNNVAIIGRYAFGGTLDYSGYQGELIIPEGVIEISEGAFRGNRFSDIHFPSTLKIIGIDCFAENSRLSSNIIIPEGVAVIQRFAFGKCHNIIGIEFPSTLNTINQDAFKECYNIRRIICRSVEPPTILPGVFTGVAKDNFTVEVPASSVKLYREENGWSDFKRIAAHYDFSVSRERMRALNASQSRIYTLRVPAHYAWSVDSGSLPEWITVSPASGTGKTDITIKVSDMARTSETFEVNEGTYNNPSYKKYKGRSSEVVFKIDEEGIDYTCTFEVEQYDSDFSDGEVKTYQTATKGSGIDIIFTGDGYDAKDIANGTFFGNAEEGYNAFFDLEPYKTYKDYFNVYAVVSQSDDSGIGTVNTVVDTKFGTYFTQNRIKVPESEPIFTWAKKADNTIDFTKALVINLLNTSAYEGICAMYADGSAIAFCPVSRDAYPYDFRGIIQHEAGGHGFGKLGDEYIYHNAFIQTCDCIDGCDHPMGDNDTQSSYGKFKSLGWYKNLSMNGDMHQVPWTHLIYNPQYSNYVDMYEGGYMHSRGVYRSEATSCMNNNIPYYSAISRQAIVERILEISGEGFTLEKFYANDNDDFGTIPTRSSAGMQIDRTWGVDPMWNRGSEEGSVVYMGEHPDYSKIK